MSLHKSILNALMVNVECIVVETELGAVVVINNEQGQEAASALRLETLRGHHRFTVDGETMVLPELSQGAVNEAYGQFNALAVIPKIKRLKDANGDQGRFTARLIEVGESYGADGDFVHSDSRNEPIVEIYDNRYANKDGFDVDGQCIGDWYASTLLRIGEGEGLDLDGGVPEWKIGAEGVEELKGWLKRYFKVNPVKAPSSEQALYRTP